MVNLAPGGLGSEEIWQEVDFTGYSLATLSFWWRYEAIDYDDQDNGRDAIEVFVGDPNAEHPGGIAFGYLPLMSTHQMGRS